MDLSTEDVACAVALVEDGRSQQYAVQISGQTEKTIHFTLLRNREIRTYIITGTYMGGGKAAIE